MLVPLPNFGRCEVLKKSSKAQQRRDALAAWWDRSPWPCVILAVDPGRAAGATILISRPSGFAIHRCEPVDTYSRELENVIGEAISVSERENLPLFLVLEDWGAGGNRGISQWLGLGEARGPWRREFLIECENYSFLRKKNVAKVNMTRWRSRVVPETGNRDENGFRRFEPDEWKVAAHRAACELFLNTWVPILDAAESACIAAYAARSDEIGNLLPKRLLASYGLTFTPLEPLIK
jgi:hypothetical protein